MFTSISFTLKKKILTMPSCVNVYCVQAIQSAHRAEEIVVNTYKALKEEEIKPRNAQRILDIKDKKLQEVTASLTKAKSEKAGFEATLKVAERQAKTQRLQRRQADEDYAAVKKLIEGFKGI